MEQITPLVLMREISSVECYSTTGQPALREISLEACAGQTLGILGGSAFELRLLAEILAGAKAYATGVCSLAGRGMMRRKGTVLEHTFYIGSTGMLLENMAVLEYLTLLTTRRPGSMARRQRDMLDLLESLGLERIALTPNVRLSPAEKTAVLLVGASLSPSVIVIVNLPRLEWDQWLYAPMAKVSARLREQGKVLLLTTQSAAMAQAISTDIAVLKDGGIAQCGPLEQLLRQWDDRRLTLSVDAEDLAAALEQALAPHGLWAEREGEEWLVRGPAAADAMGLTLEVLHQQGLRPRRLAVCEPKLDFALSKVLHHAS